MPTPSEVSEQLGIPPATLRRYVSLFGGHLSEEARLPRGRRFGEADLAVLAQIRSLLSAGSSVDEVRAALGGTPAPLPVREPTETPASPSADALESPPEPEPVEATAEVLPEDEDSGGDETEEAESRSRWRSFPKVQPVRTSREVRKMAAEMGATDHLSQRLALAEDRIRTYNERMAVLEARIAKLEEWVKTPWYRRIFSRPPDYDL